MAAATTERNPPVVRKAVAAFHRHFGILRMADVL